MSDLTTFRDHCRAMADPNPPRKPIGPFCKALWRGDIANHGKCAEVAPRGACGCDCHPWNAPVPEADRALFARLADEVDAYLAGDLVDVDLFGDETPLPEVRDA